MSCTKDTALGTTSVACVAAAAVILLFSFFSFWGASILFRQENRGDGAIRFGDDPDLRVSCACAVAAQEPEPSFQTESVFVAVFVAQVSPIAMNVACEEILRLLSCLFESVKSKCPSSGGWRPAVRAVKGAGFAFIGAKRRPLTEEAGGWAQSFRRKGR
jgi:hypothetical protein